MDAPDTTLLDGDIITIRGVYADGTREHSDTWPSLYQSKPLARFRVGESSDGRTSLKEVDERGNDLPARVFAVLPYCDFKSDAGAPKR